MGRCASRTQQMTDGRGESRYGRKHLGDLSALVVTPDQRDPVRVADLEHQEQQEGLHRVETSIDEVAHEEIIGVGDVPSHL